jgi:very-short-patch-repair endonuclease
VRGGLSERARELRRDMTPPERRLWRGLRGEGVGVRFRRQHPVPPYVLDFACVALRLAVEVDGAVRDGVLAGLGWRVVRFRAVDVMGNLEGVLGEVFRVVGEMRGEG